ncbi:MAG TPA: hypothetical protein VFD13_02905 [Candidatus Kapabacteria bacterium]|nr:hypothetical protein [Candidatus Kapabacteria bacterium]
MLLVSSVASAQETAVSRISAGLIFGNPMGASMRYPIGPTRALDFEFGPDYFGSPRLQMDYLWQFHAFRSTTVGEYFGPGLAVAFGSGINTFYTHEWGKPESFAAIEDKGFGVGGRAIFGMRITPNHSRLEFFFESGPMVAIARFFDPDIDGAFGVRYGL